MSRVLTMKLTESTNICNISETVACTVKLNIKENFLGNNGFPANVYIVNGLQSEIKRPITWRIYYLVSIPTWIQQNYFWNSLRQTSKFIWNEVDNWFNFTVSFRSRCYICLFFMSQVWTMKLTESMNICHVSVRVSHTIKVNIKETFMGNDPFLQMFIWWIHSSQRGRRITWEI